MIIIIQTAGGIGFLGLGIAAFLGFALYAVFYGWDFAINLSGIPGAPFDELVAIITSFPRNIIGLVTGGVSGLGDSDIAQMMISGALTYLVINTLAAIFIPKKFVTQVTTVITVIFCLLPLIAFFMDEPPTKLFDRVMIYIFGPVLLICMDAIPVLISTVINSIICFGFKNISE